MVSFAGRHLYRTEIVQLTASVFACYGLSLACSRELLMQIAIGLPGFVLRTLALSSRLLASSPMSGGTCLACPASSKLVVCQSFECN